MIIFIFGENSYYSFNRLKVLKEEFIKRHGDLNLDSIDAASLAEDSDIISKIEIVPFLAEKRLFVIKGLLALTKGVNIKEKIQKGLLRCPETTVLIFYEMGDFDKRQSLYKYLMKEAKVEEYKNIKGNELKNFIFETIKKRNISISQDALNLLLNMSKELDLFGLKNELEKIMMYLVFEERNEITEADVKLLINAIPHAKIFDLIDFIGKKNPNMSLKELESLFLSGGNEIYILTMIIYQFRNLILVKFLTHQEKTREQITAELKLHPFVASKCLYQVNNYSLEELKLIYEKLLEISFQMKNSEIDNRLILTNFIAQISMPSS